MRQLTRETKGVLEKLVRSGKPAVITSHGRAEAVLVPLSGSLSDVPRELFGQVPAGIPHHIREAIREAEADLVADQSLDEAPVEAEPVRAFSGRRIEDLVAAVAMALSQGIELIEGGNYRLNLDLPGIAADHVHVRVDENQVVVDATPLAHSGRSPVHRAFPIPAPIDIDKTKVQFIDGVLMVEMARQSDKGPIVIDGSGRTLELK